MLEIWGYLDPASHARMVLDRVRVDAYARALAAAVRPGDVVMDVGSGSGILALLAARAGARKVYAVESSGAVELVRAHAEANGFGEIIDVVRADASDLTPERITDPPRVVVSELLGDFAPSENQHRAFSRALALARPDSVLIPSSYRVVLAPASPAYLEDARTGLADVSGVSLPALSKKMLSRVTFLRVTPDELRGTESSTAGIDLRGALPSSFAATSQVTKAGPITSISAGFVATLYDGVEIATAPTAPRTCWMHGIFPLDPPLEAAPGDEIEMIVRPRLVTHRGTWTWSARIGDERRDGDAMGSFIGDQHDMLEQLGLRSKPAGRRAPSRTLDAWAAILGGMVEGDVDAMAERLLAAQPDRYSDHADARQEVLALLAAAGALA